jgi:hypothetical protein
MRRRATPIILVLVVLVLETVCRRPSRLKQSWLALWIILHAKTQHAPNIDDEDENDYESRGVLLLAPRF